MNEHEIEARLRRALAARASSVEPGAGDVGPLEARATAARRARQRWTVVLSAAAVVLAVAAVAGAVALRDDDPDTEVATEGPTTTAEEPATTSTTTSTTSTSTTAPPLSDDGVQGWPGATSRMFDDPDAAALAFVTDILGFADPALADSTVEGDDAEVVYHPNPRASVNTTLSVHNTGELRGWVVTGLTSNQGSIDDVTFDGTTVTLSGSASAFEAHVTILVLDAEGNVLAESFTMASGSAEQGPYEASIEVEPAAGTPFWVMIAEGDASGEGEFLWAATSSLQDQ